MRAERRLELVRPAVGEAVEADVADGPAGQVAALDLLLEDDVAGDLDGERLVGAALDGEGDDRALGAADPLARAVDGQSVEADPVGREDEVPGRQPGGLGRAALQRRDDDQAAVRAERGTALLTGRVLGRDLGTDALELAADALEALAVLVRREVRRVRILERVDHPADGALDQGVAVDVAAGIAVVDGVVGVPERAERLVVTDRGPWLRGGLATERVARHEQGAAGEDRDQGDGHRQDQRPACGSTGMRASPARPRRGRPRPAACRPASACQGWDRGSVAGSGSDGVVTRRNVHRARRTGPSTRSRTVSG